jgi:hypothetical protein
MNQPPMWRKSSYSQDGPNCVELSDTHVDVLLRNSNLPEQGHISFSRNEMAAFIAGIKAGEFDDLA